MKHLALAVMLMLGCRSPGTISVDFTLSATSEACGTPPAQPRLIVYAEPRTFCSSCTCGECLGVEDDDEICGSAEEDCEIGSPLDLEPGHWAVVMSLWQQTGELGIALVASQCIDVDVDVDGVASKHRGDGEPIECAATCATDSSSAP